MPELAAFAQILADSGSGTGIVTVSPPVLFFFLGAGVVALRSSISIPEGATKVLSLYLLWAIGFKGGVELVSSGFTPDALRAVGLGLALSLTIPVWSYLLLRRLTPGRDAAALAACYGSVSVVTFLTACAALEDAGTPYGGHMVAVMALMESPAILVALLLLNLDRRARAQDEPQPGSRPAWGTILHESLLNGPVLLLLGSIVVGVLTGDRGYRAFKPLCTDAFPGVLAFFLLDLGMLAAKRAKAVLRAPWPVLGFAVVAPVVHGAIALAAARALGLSEGDAVLMAVLASSASYIAAPAALRMAIPRADPALYVSLSLALTFPFNILIGIPLYAWAASAWW